MDIVNYLLRFAFDAIISLLIIRVWLQLVRADFYHPLSQFVVKVTNPVVVPFRRIIPGFAGIDIATIVIAFIFATLKYSVIPFLMGGPFDPLAATYFGGLFLIKQTGFLLFMCMIIMAVMSWVVQGYNPTMVILQQLTQPILAPIRRIIPPIGGLDLSIIAAFLLLNVLNMFIGKFVPYWHTLF
ncbi:YggT family protein [Thalassotalea agarivorans]|uniref:YggT family protein n=1 Tax=Thalassotalea agarivorans TaxID=349064 RepID=A0A1I0HH41_THASX|nr:YggT family protein [Thalassotalea agarivorans]SET83129.1 YggT family protein [Thalassotalea agarivorans]